MINFIVKYGGFNANAITNPIPTAPTIELSGTVFPLNIGNFLDEQLDEASLTAKFSRVHPKDLKIGERISVTILKDGTEVETLYFILSNLKSVETPNGSGFYTHTLGLIELTKELEGIVCQTLTFTNGKTTGDVTNKWVTEEVV